MNIGPRKDDDELLEEYLTSENEAAFGELIRRYHGFVLSICLRHLPNTSDAEDVAQAAFLVLAHKAKSLRGTKCLAGWLHKTARFCSLRVCRDEKRRRIREQKAFERRQMEMEQHEKDDPHLRHVLDELLLKLPQRYRDVIYLHYLQELKLPQVAEKLQLTEPAVAMRLQRAREKLRKLASRRALTASTGAILAALTTEASAAAGAAQKAAVILKGAAALKAGSSAGVAANVMAASKGVIQTMMLGKMKVLAIGLIVVGFAVAVSLPGGRAIAADGDLDTAFGSGGIAAVNLTQTEFNTNGGDVCLDANGNHVVAGSVSMTPDIVYLAVSRFTPGGALDTSFSGDGRAFFDGGDEARGAAVAMQGNKIIALGTKGEGAGTDFVVIRVNTDGTLDSSFGTDGKTVIDVGDYDAARGLAVQSDNKIVIVGNTRDGGERWAAVRLTADGGMDSSFGSAGVRIININGGSVQRCNDVCLDEGNNRIIVGGNATVSGGNGRAYVLALNIADGSNDNSFSGDGKVGFEFTDYPAVSTSGGITCSGGDVYYTTTGATNTGPANQFVVAKVDATGALDSGFSGDGIAEGLMPGSAATRGGGEAVAVRADGKVLVVGVGLDVPNHAGAVQFNADGSIDSSFGNSGFLDLPDYSTLVGVLSSGSGGSLGIHAVCTKSDAYNSMALLKLNGDGSFDTAYGESGVAATALRLPTLDTARGIVPANDKFLIYGEASANDDEDLGLFRLNSDGTLDTTFSADGIYIHDLIENDTAVGAGTQSDEKIILASVGAVMRLTTGGALDTSFGTDGITTIDFTVTAMTILSDDSIVLGGTKNTTANKYVTAAAKLTPDGALDSSFSGDGIAYIDLNTNAGRESAYAVAAQSDGKIILGGDVPVDGSFPNLAIARLNADGSQDSTFATDGAYTANIAQENRDDRVYALYVDGDDKIIAAGHAWRDCFILRLNADGAADNSFDSNGTRVLDLVNDNDIRETVYGIANTSEGYLLAIETIHRITEVSELRTALVSTDGSFDTSYGSNGVQTYGNDYLQLGRGIAVNADESRAFVASGDLMDIAVARIVIGDAPANNPPVITEGAGTSVTMDEDGSPTAFDLTLHATDDDGDSMTWSIGITAGHGIAGVSGNASGDTATVTFSPEADYYGDDSFTVVVSDGTDTDSITVNVTINPQDEPGGEPEVNVQVGGNDIANGATAGGPSIVSGNTSSITITIQNTGAANLSVSNAATSSASNCTVGLTMTPATSIAASNSSDAVVEVTPTAVGGSWSFAFSFDTNDTDEADYSITINGTINGAPNNAPVISSGPSISPDPVTIPNAADATVTATDADGDTLTYTWSRDSGPGTPAFSPNSTTAASSTSVTFNAAGDYTLCVTVSDGTDDVSSTVTITVNPAVGAGDGRMQVLGNGVAISDGDSTPDTADNTNFGAAYEADGSITKTFTINNSGTGPLLLNGSPVVAISGANAADFTVSSNPAASIATGESTTFDITFDPSAVGARTATVTIESDDSTLPSFDFAIAGEGLEGATPVAPPADDDDDDGCSVGFGGGNLLAMLVVMLVAWIRRRNL